MKWKISFSFWITNRFCCRSRRSPSETVRRSSLWKMRPTPSTSEWSVRSSPVFARSPHTLLFIESVKLVRSSSPQWGCDLGCAHFFLLQIASPQCFSRMTEVVFNIFCVAFRPRPSAVSISSVQVCRQNVLIFVQLFCKCNLCPIHFFPVVVFNVIFFFWCFVTFHNAVSRATHSFFFFYLLSYSGDLHQRE